MIVLTVLSYNDAAAEGLSAGFDEMGGTIGRSDKNQLVLPDPERTVSRVHARIVFRSSGYGIVDLGSNPVSVNAVAVGNGLEAALKPGDRVQIGGYILQASEGRASAASSDAFADLFGDADGGLAAPAGPVAAFHAPAPRPALAPAPAPSLAPPAPVASNWAASAAAAQASHGGQIPEDWNPFSVSIPSPLTVVTPAGASRSSSRSPSLSTLGLDLQAPADDSLDKLFGLGAAAAPGAALGGTGIQELLFKPNTAGHADPLLSLERTTTIVPRSVSDHVSELKMPMPMPMRAPPPPPPAPAMPPVRHQPSPPAGPNLPVDGIFSWDAPSREGLRISPTGAATVIAPSAPSAPFTPARPSPSRAALPTSAVLAPASPTGAAASDNELLAALMQGLSCPDLRLDALTPALMQQIGQVLRESTRGAVDLLVARAAFKRELRADVTMIVARENNPLKFSPSVEVALQYLLGSSAQGFMPAAPAVRDAFDDLRAHQLGVMAGMRAALDGVFRRFDPQQLETQLVRTSRLDSLIPQLRHARLWELFQTLFAQLSADAQDDFHELFGRAFLQAYEDQLESLRHQPGPG